MDNTLEGMGQVPQMVDQLYPKLYKLVQDFMQEHQGGSATLKDSFFAVMYSLGKVLGNMEGAALRGGIGPKVLFQITSTAMQVGRAMIANKTGTSP